MIMLSIPTQKRTAPTQLLQLAKAEAHNILMNTRGVDFVMICSSDGFELATVSHKSHHNTTKLAAVSSSILAMVTAFLKEIQLTGCNNITLDADNGKAILTAIPAVHHPMVMVTLSNKEVLLGQLLYSLKKASQTIAEADGE